MTGSAGANTAADTRTSAPQTAPRPSATTIAARRRASGPSAPSALSSLTSAVSVPVTYVVDMVGASVRAVAAWMPIATPETAMSHAAARRPRSALRELGDHIRQRAQVRQDSGRRRFERLAVTVDEDRPESERGCWLHVVVLARPDVHHPLGRRAATLEEPSPMPRG